MSGDFARAAGPASVEWLKNGLKRGRKFYPATGAAGVVLADRGTYSGWMLREGGWPDICAAIAG